MTAYLVRTLDNRISGPFSKEQISKHILEGVLRARDEICPSNEYWFFVQEREETLKYLGVEMPVHRDPDDDVTVTETITATNPAEVLRAANAPAPIEGATGPSEKLITDLAPSPLESLTATPKSTLEAPEVKIEFPFYFKLSVWMVLAILIWMGFQIYRQIYPDYSYPPASQIAPGLKASPSIAPTASALPETHSTPAAAAHESP